MADSQNVFNQAYLETVLVRHKLLCFALVSRFRGGPGRLGGEGAPGGLVGVLSQVEVCHTHADVITDYVLELRKK